MTASRKTTRKIGRSKAPVSTRESAKAKCAFSEFLLLGENATLSDLAASRKSVGETSVKRRSKSGLRQLERWSAQHAWMARRDAHFEAARKQLVDTETKRGMHAALRAQAKLQENAGALVDAAISVATGTKVADLPMVMMLRDALARAGILNLEKTPRVALDVAGTVKHDHEHKGGVTVHLVRPDNGRRGPPAAAPKPE